MNGLGKFSPALAIMFLLPQLLLANEDAKRLYDDLMVSYNRHRRPANSPQDTATVKLKLRLSQIIDVVSCICMPHMHGRLRPD